MRNKNKEKTRFAGRVFSCEKFVLCLGKAWAVRKAGEYNPHAMLLCSGETRNKGASCALTGIPLAHLRLSKIAAVNLPASGAICNPSPRFNVTFFGLSRAKRVYTTQYIVGLAFLPHHNVSLYDRSVSSPLSMPPLMVRGGVTKCRRG